MKIRTHTRILHSLLATIVASLAIPAHAATVAHWRFEGSDFLADSSGNNHGLTNNGSVTQVATTFPNPVLQTGQANLNAASFDGSNYLSAADNNAFTNSQFTLEAFFSPSSLPGSTETRTIAGHFGSSGSFDNQRSYGLFVRGSSLRVMMSNNGAGFGNVRIWDVGTIAANARYYAAMAVDTSTQTATIYLQDLSTDTLQVFVQTDAFSTLHNSTAPFTIGSTGQGTALWQGMIDEVRLSNVKLTQDQLLVIPEPSAALLGGLGLLALFRRRR